ncbi:MAG: hypothetical protein C0412_15135 [Flavobacterium sp.]|nr:hypothetical protein [Flavobacterium sp.]
MFKNEIKTEYLEKNERVKKFYERKKRIIEKIFEDIKSQIGEGMTAKVCLTELKDKLCFKILKDPINSPNIPYHVSLDEEMEFLRTLRNMDADVEVPAPYIAADYSNDDNPEGFRFLMMEKLNAVSIRDILDGKGDLPADFNIASFRNKMSDFIEKMHSKNIYHRDFHEGNIMIDSDTGKLYVIDFGASTKSYGDEDPYKQVLARDTKFYTSDENRLIKVCVLLRNHMLTNRK